MKYLIPCTCGSSVAVTASQAGTSTTCRCGECLDVPSFGDLERSYREVEEIIEKTASKHIGKIVLGFAGAILLLLLVSKNQPALVLASLGCILIGKVRPCATMIREMGAPALLILIAPFFDWLFVFKRFEIAWKPVALQIVGFLFLVAAFRIL